MNSLKLIESALGKEWYSLIILDFNLIIHLLSVEAYSKIMK
jgi:hypothetical protein